MKIKIKKDVIEKFMKENSLTKNKFSKNCYIAVKTFDKLMRGEKIELWVALKIAGCMKIDFNALISYD